MVSKHLVKCKTKIGPTALGCSAWVVDKEAGRCGLCKEEGEVSMAALLNVAQSDHEQARFPPRAKIPESEN